MVIWKKIEVELEQKIIAFFHELKTKTTNSDKAGPTCKRHVHCDQFSAPSAKLFSQSIILI